MFKPSTEREEHNTKSQEFEYGGLGVMKRK